MARRKRVRAKRPSAVKQLGTITAAHQRKLPEPLKRKFEVIESRPGRLLVKAPLEAIEKHALPASLGLVLKRLELYSSFSVWIPQAKIVEYRFSLMTDNYRQWEEWEHNAKARHEAEYRRRHRLNAKKAA